MVLNSEMSTLLENTKLLRLQIKNQIECKTNNILIDGIV